MLSPLQKIAIETTTAKKGSSENGGEKLGHGSGGMELLRAA